MAEKVEVVIKETPYFKSSKRATLEQKSIEGEHKRQEVIKNIIHLAIIILICISVISISITILVRIFHLVLPENLQWLTKEQINTIDHFLFSGAIGGFVAGYIRKSFKNGK